MFANAPSAVPALEMDEFPIVNLVMKYDDGTIRKRGFQLMILRLSIRFSSTAFMSSWRHLALHGHTCLLSFGMDLTSR
jgi:hypothetical protein